MNKINEITTRTTKIWLDDVGIIHSLGLPGVDHSLEDAINIVKAIVAVSEGKARPLLSDIRQIKSIDREARQHLADSEINDVVLANAVMVDSPLSRMIGNFFNGFNKPPIPLKLFSDETEAVNWLLEFMK